MIARAEVCADDQFVLESFGSLDEVIQMHVAVFVDFLAAMVGSDEAQLRDEDFCLKGRWVAVEPRGACVAGVADQRRAHFASHLHARLAQITYFFSRQADELVPKFVAALPDNIADAG